VSLKIRSYS